MLSDKFYPWVTLQWKNLHTLQNDYLKARSNNSHLMTMLLASGLPADIKCWDAMISTGFRVRKYRRILVLNGANYWSKRKLVNESLSVVWQLGLVSGAGEVVIILCILWHHCYQGFTLWLIGSVYRCEVEC